MGKKGLRHRWPNPKSIPLISTLSVSQIERRAFQAADAVCAKVHQPEIKQFPLVTAESSGWPKASSVTLVRCRGSRGDLGMITEDLCDLLIHPRSSGSHRRVQAREWRFRTSPLAAYEDKTELHRTEEGNYRETPTVTGMEKKEGLGKRELNQDATAATQTWKNRLGDKLTPVWGWTKWMDGDKVRRGNLFTRSTT